MKKKGKKGAQARSPPLFAVLRAGKEPEPRTQNPCRVPPERTGSASERRHRYDERETGRDEDSRPSGATGTMSGTPAGMRIFIRAAPCEQHETIGLVPSH